MEDFQPLKRRQPLHLDDLNEPRRHYDKEELEKARMKLWSYLQKKSKDLNGQTQTAELCRGLTRGGNGRGRLKMQTFDPKTTVSRVLMNNIVILLNNTEIRT